MCPITRKAVSRESLNDDDERTAALETRFKDAVRVLNVPAAIDNTSFITCESLPLDMGLSSSLSPCVGSGESCSETIFCINS